jgi:cell division protein FtsB
MTKIKQDYKKLYKKVNEELEEKRVDVRDMEQEIYDLRKELEVLKASKNITERSNRDAKDQYIYATGMLSVLKRLSRLYPEEMLTSEEYRQIRNCTNREILSEVDLSF